MILHCKALMGWGQPGLKLEFWYKSSRRSRIDRVWSVNLQSSSLPLCYGCILDFANSIKRLQILFYLHCASVVSYDTLWISIVSGIVRLRVKKLNRKNNDVHRLCFIYRTNLSSSQKLYSEKYNTVKMIKRPLSAYLTDDLSFVTFWTTWKCLRYITKTPYVLSFKAKGSNCVYKWLVDRPFCLEADDVFITWVQTATSPRPYLPSYPCSCCLKHEWAMDPAGYAVRYNYIALSGLRDCILK